MHNDSYQDFQYDGCVSRGICSISPRISALQTVLVLYLRLFAKFAQGVNINTECKNFILNTIAITIYNPDFNEKSFLFAIDNFKKELPKLINEFYKTKPNDGIEAEKEKALELFRETSDIIPAIKFGEQIFNRGLKTIPATIRDLYNIMLVVAKSLSINLLELESYEKENEEAFSKILKLLSRINLEENNIESLKEEIQEASDIDVELLKEIRDAQEERYGEQQEIEVSYTTVPNKAVLVVGSNIRELESVLEALKETDIDVYTHDDMMLAHTFPKFSSYPQLRGQFGQGIENCLLDFATFPGPIILTKHSLHNIENFYRGRLFTTDYTSSPTGIIKLENDNFSKVIESAEQAKGFKTGKQCESVSIGYSYEKITSNIDKKIKSSLYDRIFIIGLDGYSLEQRTYFEKLIKLAPENILILSFSYNFGRENIIHINTCFDYYSWIKIIEFTEKYNIAKTIFVPKCDKSTVSQIIYLSNFEKTDIYLGKCTPIILNPTLMNTLQESFKIKDITNARKDLEEILEDK